MTLFSSVATLWKVLWLWLFPPGDQGEIKPTKPWPEKQRPPTKVTPLGKTIQRQEDGWLVRTSWQVSTGEEARVYGYAYLGSRMETPFPVPDEFQRIVFGRLAAGGMAIDSVDKLYNDLQQYFKVQARTWHQVWALCFSREGPVSMEKDLLLRGEVLVYSEVLIPGWAVFNPVYQDQPDSRPKDDDYFVLSCALSVAGTRDTQDVRAEAVQTVTIRELKEA